MEYYRPKSFFNTFFVHLKLVRCMALRSSEQCLTHFSSRKSLQNQPQWSERGNSSKHHQTMNLESAMLGAFIQPRAWRLFCHCRRPSLELDCCRFLFNCRNPGMNFGGCLDADRWCIFGMIAFYNKNIRICVYTLYDTDMYIYTHYMKYIYIWYIYIHTYLYIYIYIYIYTCDVMNGMAQVNLARMLVDECCDFRSQHWF